VERFFSEVARVLKPNGYFLYADMRYLDEVDHWRAQLRRTGLRLLSEENITPNVIRALALDRERKRKLIDQYAPRLLRKPFNEFAGMTGAGLAPDSNNRGLARGSPKDGERIYLNFLFRKQFSYSGVA
jgi:SAM-dependent methyltransferase